MVEAGRLGKAVFRPRSSKRILHRTSLLVIVAPVERLLRRKGELTSTSTIARLRWRMPESRTTFPSRISTRRDAARATSSLWVTTISVVSRSAAIFSSNRITRRRGMRIEIAGRFVRDQQRRPVDQRAGDRRSLLLATAELMSEVSRSVSEPDQIDQLRRPFFTFMPAARPARAMES